MRLLMLDNEFPPLGGGTAVVNFHLLQELARIPDVEVDLVTSHGGRTGRLEERLSERIRVLRVAVDNRDPHHARHRELLRYGARGLLACFDLLRQRDYDAVFAFSGLPAGAMALALKHFYGLPYLVSLQGRDVPGFDLTYRRLYPFLTPLIRRVWREASAVTVISQGQRLLARRTLPSLDPHVVHNAVDVDRFSPPADDGRAGDGLNVLCVARLVARKGHRFLLRAIAEVRRQGLPVRLTLAGQGNEQPSLLRLARELGIADCVSFLGFVPRESIAEVYRAAHVFVLPSENEGMSIALLEAMASALPVVVTFAGGTAELVEDGVNGFVVPFGEPSALAAALLRLCAEPETRHRMARAGRARAQSFSWPAFTRRHLEICAQVAAPAVRRAAVCVEPDPIDP